MLLPPLFSPSNLNGGHALEAGRMFSHAWRDARLLAGSAGIPARQSVPEHASTLPLRLNHEIKSLKVFAPAALKAGRDARAPREKSCPLASKTCARPLSKSVKGSMLLAKQTRLENQTLSTEGEGLP